MTTELRKRSPQEQRSQLFGSYKAEWLREQVFELYAEPDYFPELTTRSPCVYVGGRGTGKTTVLRCMSYDGQFALHARNPQTILEWPYYGFYYRVNTNRVTAFSGPELDQQRWTRAFAHYFNLVLCDLAVRFLEWYQLHSPNPALLPPSDCANIAASLAIESADTLPDLARSIARAKLLFEAYINNVVDAEPLRLSLQGAPLDELFASLRRFDQFKDKDFFFLLDEYENFQDYQQQVVNTLIKHSGDLYTFKIGVKELGWRIRTTLNENEQLISPADYVRINIAEKLEGDRFDNFALRVSNERIRRFDVEGGKIEDVGTLLPGLTEEEEAKLLDRESGVVTASAASLAEVVPTDQRANLEQMSLLQRYCLVTWSENQNVDLQLAWRSYLKEPDSWVSRFNNYNHALLYTIRSGKRGIRKYYCGSRVLTQMAASNIRYFLELVDQSIALHVQKGRALNETVDPATQTEAAQRVGQKNLSELEGLSVHGGKLTKLVLGLGRIFQVMASDAFGHTPEVNQFHLSHSDANLTSENNLNDLLTAAVMHLALLRFPGNKLVDESDTREYDYMLHPIFSAFFSFSYRRKRKLVIAPSHLLELVTDHKRAIREILATQNRDDAESLPDQLQLFGSYYDVAAKQTNSN